MMLGAGYTRYINPVTETTSCAQCPIPCCFLSNESRNVNLAYDSLE